VITAFPAKHLTTTPAMMLPENHAKGSLTFRTRQGLLIWHPFVFLSQTFVTYSLGVRVSEVFHHHEVVATACTIDISTHSTMVLAGKYGKVLLAFATTVRLLAWPPLASSEQANIANPLLVLVPQFLHQHEMVAAFGAENIPAHSAVVPASDEGEFALAFGACWSFVVSDPPPWAQ